MSKKSSWPIRKGLFRTTCRSEFSPQRSPSPIVEMPLSPQSDLNDTPRFQTRNTPPLKVNINAETPLSPLSPLSNRSAGPFSPTINIGIREIPIEVQQEVCFCLNSYVRYYCVRQRMGSHCSFHSSAIARVIKTMSHIYITFRVPINSIKAVKASQ